MLVAVLLFAYLLLIAIATQIYNTHIRDYMSTLDILWALDGVIAISTGPTGVFVKMGKEERGDGQKKISRVWGTVLSFRISRMIRASSK